jgi:hypothetical protein
VRQFRTWFLATAGAAVALIMTSTAFAGSPAEDVYGGVAGDIQSGVASGVGGANPDGSLPFTGLNLWLIVVGAIALIAVGLLLRRRAPRETA